MKTLFSKRVEKRIGLAYRIRSDNKRTVGLAAIGCLPLMAFAVGCFLAMAIIQDYEHWFMAGFVGGIAAAIGWVFFAITYGHKHFENVRAGGQMTQAASTMPRRLARQFGLAGLDHARRCCHTSPAGHLPRNVDILHRSPKTGLKRPENPVVYLPCNRQKLHRYLPEN